MNKQKVAELVRSYLKDCHPNGMTLEVIESKIRKGKGWWDVPIRLSMEPPKRYKLDEALVKVEIGLQDRENLAVFLIPIFPKDVAIELQENEGLNVYFVSVYPNEPEVNA